MTMKELAKLANVSVSTVSKAFHEADDVSQETKELIFKLAKEQGCFGQFYKGRFHRPVIAVLCPEFKSAHYTDYLERLQTVIEQNGGIMTISAYRFDPGQQAELIEYYASYLQVDGLIVFGLREPLKKAYKIPVVSIGSSTQERIDVVRSDLAPAIEEAVAHLSALGHRKIAFLGEPLTQSKELEVAKFASQQGMDYYLALTSNARFEQAGEDCARQLLALTERPTALICGYDYIAFGAIKYLKKKGYHIPEDFSVIGMDNIAETEYIETALTTIDSGTDQVCRIAWELMEKKQKNEYYHLHRQITVTGKLILRETTAIAKNSPSDSSK
ncbi:MAG: LacI family DNA-binding transcriptional regulator [Clostridia bacterium]|nr:LacI family DNA-binding transcriptional regulator [Clostridia bacterium]